MESSHHPPRAIPQHDISLILTSTIVGVKIHMLLSQTMVGEKMELTHNCISAISCVHTFVAQIVCLSGNCLTTYPKQGTLPRSQEVNRSRLHEVGGIMHLLCIIKRIVRLLWASKRSGSGMWWRRMESFVLLICTSDSTSALIIDGVIEHSFSLCLFDVFQCLLQCLRLLLIVAVRGSQHKSVVLLSLPTEISHWLHYDNMWNKSLPQCAGFARYRIPTAIHTRLTVLGPNSQFGGARW